MAAIEFTTIEVWPNVLTLWISPYLKLSKFNKLVMQGKVGKKRKKYCQNLNTTVGFDMKVTLQTPPTTTHHTNFSGTSRRARELKFGTDTH